MDEARFDVVVARLFARGSRRAVVWSVAAGALGLGGAVLPAESTEAKRKKKKKKKKGGSTGGGTPAGGNPSGGDNGGAVAPPAVSLETCRTTCGENCACAYSPAGDIFCGTADNAGVCEDCQAGDGCTFGACVAGVYAVGQTSPTRFNCQYRDGVCANLTSCAV